MGQSSGGRRQCSDPHRQGWVLEEEHDTAAALLPGLSLSGLMLHGQVIGLDVVENSSALGLRYTYRREMRCTMKILETEYTLETLNPYEAKPLTLVPDVEPSIISKPKNH